MQANNLKLAEGIHKFTRINGSLDEYINEEFKFEEIKYFLVSTGYEL